VAHDGAMDIGAIEVTRAGAANPYVEGIWGAERSGALGAFLRGRPTPGYEFWHAPSCGGARRLDERPAVRPEVVDFYWRADGTPRRR
jgi:hypothetical protein